MVMLDPWPTLTIEGRPASKKNSRKIVTPRGKSHSVLVNDARYQKWHRGAMTALWAQWRPRPTITGTVGMELTVFMAPVQRLDLGNVVTAVCDALQAARVVADDKQIVVFERCSLSISRDPYLSIRLWPVEEIRQPRRRGATPGLGL